MPTTDELQSQINALQSQLNSILGMADDDYIHQYSGEEIDAGITAAGKAVRYDLAQSLTTAQQKQARDNIGADAVQGAVRYDLAQALTTAQQAQARSNIDAAPDGYGLGNAPTDVTSLASITKNGFYSIHGGDAPDGGYWQGVHLGGAAKYGALQIMESQTNAKGCACLRYTWAGEWTPWEWVNPPLALGVEYRTTERYLGKPVYTTIVNFGAISAGTNTIAHNLVSVEQMVGCELIDVSGYVAGQPSTLFATANKSSVYIEATGSQYVGRKIYVRLRYTKSTD